MSPSYLNTSLKQTTLTKAIAFALFGGLSLGMLSGCGSSDDRANATSGHEHHDHEGHDHEGHDHHHDAGVDAEIAQGRLLIADHDNHKAYVYSLTQNKVIQTIDNVGHIDTLQTSPQGKYVLSLDRENN